MSPKRVSTQKLRTADLECSGAPSHSQPHHRQELCKQGALKIKNPDFERNHCFIFLRRSFSLPRKPVAQACTSNLYGVHQDLWLLYTNKTDNCVNLKHLTLRHATSLRGRKICIRALRCRGPQVSSFCDKFKFVCLSSGQKINMWECFLHSMVPTKMVPIPYL